MEFKKYFFSDEFAEQPKIPGVPDTSSNNTYIGTLMSDVDNILFYTPSHTKIVKKWFSGPLISDEDVDLEDGLQLYLSQEIKKLGYQVDLRNCPLIWLEKTLTTAPSVDIGNIPMSPLKPNATKTQLTKTQVGKRISTGKLWETVSRKISENITNIETHFTLNNKTKITEQEFAFMLDPTDDCHEFIQIME